MLDGNKYQCDKCGSKNTISHGARYECKSCKHYGRKQTEPGAVSFAEKPNGKAVVSAVFDRPIMSLDDLIFSCQIDTGVWIVENWTSGTNQGYRKDRQVEWEVRNGMVIYGSVKDSGKLITKTLYNVKAFLRRKTFEIDAQRIKDDLLRDFSRAYKSLPKPVSVGRKGEMMLEIDFPDIHFGKLTWSEESAHDYSMSVAEQMVSNALSKLLQRAGKERISKILLPLGNDFFNSDNASGTTTKGTPQQEEDRWTRTFRFGTNLARKMIETCEKVAPVDVLIMPGNHDATRTFYMGEVIAAFYSRSKYVKVDNRPKATRYYKFGTSMIGFNHGEMSLDRLAGMMPLEEPSMWAETQHREWHLGHYHKTKALQFKTETINGIVFRYLMSMTGADVWHFGKGFIGGKRSAEAFLYHKTEGLISNINAIG